MLASFFGRTNFLISPQTKSILICKNSFLSCSKKNLVFRFRRNSIFMPNLIPTFVLFLDHFWKTELPRTLSPIPRTPFMKKTGYPCTKYAEQ